MQRPVRVTLVLLAGLLILTSLTAENSVPPGIPPGAQHIQPDSAIGPDDASTAGGPVSPLPLALALNGPPFSLCSPVGFSQAGLDSAGLTPVWQALQAGLGRALCAEQSARASLDRSQRDADWLRATVRRR